MKKGFNSSHFMVKAELARVPNFSRSVYIEGSFFPRPEDKTPASGQKILLWDSKTRHLN